MLDIVLLIVLAVLLIVFAAGFLFEFGHGGLDHWPARCPACGRQTLRPRAARTRDRSQLLLCDDCGAEFREELDGRLTTVSPS